MKKKRMVSIMLISAMCVLSACSGGKKANGSAAETLADSTAESAVESTSETVAGDTQISGEQESEAGGQASVPALYPVVTKEYRSVSSEDGTAVLVTGKFPQVTLKNTGYEKLAAALDSWNEEIKTTVEQLVTEDAAAAKETLEYDMSLGDDTHLPYTEDSDAVIMRADEKAFSIRRGSYSYTGGVHGMYSVFCSNFDSVTGEKLSLDDVVADKDALCEKILQNLDETYGRDIFFEGYEQSVEDEVFGNERDGYKMELVWSLEADGITAYFMQYDLAPYSEGLLTAKILYHGNEAIFADGEMFKRQDRVVPVSLSQKGYVEVNGTYEELYLDEKYNDESEFEKNMQVRLGGQEVTVGADYGIAAAYLIQKKGGQNWLYVETMSDNDYRILNVFDLSQATPVYEGYFAGGSFYDNVPSDPDDFLLSARMNLLSTYYAEKAYRIGEDGMPEALEEAYRSDAIELTAKMDIAAFSGENMDEACVIPLGSIVTIVGTDNETWVDLKDSEGTVYRVYVDGEWPQKIDGTDIDDCFEGIVFAG